MTPFRFAPTPGCLAGILALMAAFATGCGPSSAPQNTAQVPQDEIQGPAGRLHVDDGGVGGVPVVFVHSYAGSGAHWANQLSHLRASRRAVAFDLRGHGESEAPASNDYAVDALASDIAAAVDSLKIERFILVGHSMGGSASIAYAGAHPGRVAGLVLVGTPGKSDPAQAAKVMGAMEAQYDTVSEGYWKSLLADAKPEVETRVREDMKRVPKEPSLAMIRAVFAYDPMPALAAYPGPKLIIDTPHGDGPTALHNQVPEVPRKVIEGTSHWVQMDEPDQFNTALDEFLATAR